jgi:hypothetical protein
MSRDPEYYKNYYRLNRETILAKRRVYEKKYRLTHKKKNDPEYHRAYYQAHKEIIRAKAKKYYEEHPEPRKAYMAKYRAGHLEKARQASNLWSKTHKPESRIAAKKFRQNQKLKILKHYGGNPPKCACCNEKNIEFLALDHIEGGGRKHRASLKGKYGGNAFYYWIIKNKFPEGFRILCHNCNQSLGLYGYCPHQKLEKNPPGFRRAPRC